MMLNTLHNCFVYAKKVNKDLKVPTAVCKEHFRYFVVTGEICVKFRRQEKQILIEF